MVVEEAGFVGGASEFAATILPADFTMYCTFLGRNSEYEDFC